VSESGLLLNTGCDVSVVFDLSEQGIVPVPANCMSMYPAKISCRLSLWKRSTFHDFAVCADNWLCYVVFADDVVTFVMLETKSQSPISRNFGNIWLTCHINGFSVILLGKLLKPFEYWRDKHTCSACCVLHERTAAAAAEVMDKKFSWSYFSESPCSVCPTAVLFRTVILHSESCIQWSFGFQVQTFLWSQTRPDFASGNPNATGLASYWL